MREKRDGEGAEVVSKGTALAIGIDLGATRQITVGTKRNTNAMRGRERGKSTNKINTTGVIENTQMMKKKNVSAAKSIVIVTGIGTTVTDIVVDVIADRGQGQFNSNS